MSTPNGITAWEFHGHRVMLTGCCQCKALTNSRKSLAHGHTRARRIPSEPRVYIEEAHGGLNGNKDGLENYAPTHPIKHPLFSQAICKAIYGAVLRIQGVVQ